MQHENARQTRQLTDSSSDGRELRQEDEGERPRRHLRHPRVLGVSADELRPGHLNKRHDIFSVDRSGQS